MKYDFTSILDRKGWDAIAVDAVGLGEGAVPGGPKDGFDVIPMWVADMNFPTVPTVQQALIERASHPAFGYFDPREEYFEEIIRWQTQRNGAEGLLREHIGYENGVLGGAVSALNTICSRGDKVLIHSPTYIGFTGCLGESGYKLIHSPLIPDAEGIYRMDFEDMEQKIREHNIHAMVFCSPHNPTGRAWERWEVEKVMTLCQKHDVYVISDEIWSDIILPGYCHTPTQSVSEDARNRTFAFYAPSKTFNLAGLVGSYHIVYNKRLRDRLRKESATTHYNNMNLMSMYALIGAYKPEGYQWVDELRQVIGGNVDFAMNFIRENFKGVKVSRPQGTYMMFLDCTDWCVANHKTIHELLRAGWDVGVAWQDGTMFNGPCHIRMNLALPLSRVQEAFRRLGKYVFCVR